MNCVVCLEEHEDPLCKVKRHCPFEDVPLTGRIASEYRPGRIRKYNKNGEL